MDIGLFLPMEPAGRSASQVYSDAIEIAQAAEELGFHSVWITSRHLSSEYASVPSPLVLLAAMAAKTHTVVLGTAVVSMPLEDPIRLGEDFATLDALAGGRARLGVGSGDDPPAFEAMGVEFATHKEVTSARVSKLIEILDSGTVGNLRLHPPVTNARDKLALGVQSVGGARWAASLRITLLQGRSEPGKPDPSPSQAEAAKAYREIYSEGRVITARNAWVGSLDDPELRAGISLYDAYLRNRGRDPLPEGLQAAAEKMNILTGEPEQLAERLVENVAAISPDELLITVDPGGLPAAEAEKRLEALGPHLRKHL
jgi:alkanesulfonate monooxygenase SsuD/methylene tetrahydromethanopterin reductase-like flavin-dependent oxidoreductase (luciferase family)